jgi:hypothetical protein
MAKNTLLFYFYFFLWFNYFKAHVQTPNNYLIGVFISPLLLIITISETKKVKLAICISNTLSLAETDYI